ncbi:MAG: GTP-binding protein [Promethearchaeota archaeon]
MSYRQKKISEILTIMQERSAIRNIALVGHIDHGKTTLSDSLLAEAGLLSANLAGEARVLDYLDEEQRRGITMKSANISLYYEKSLEKPILVNLVDTPGHLDFSGKVTRALRLVDGVIVIVDAVEEISSQSETVVRQALNEGVKPILFINKIDRLITELKMDPAVIEEKLNRIISRFNELVEDYANPPFDDEWRVDAKSGSVVFGSALHKWGFTLVKIVEKGWKFGDIVEAYQSGTQGSLQDEFPVWDAVLHAVAEHIPNPLVAQEYRMEKIWKGELDTPVGRALLSCDAREGAPLVMCFSKVTIEKHGIVATGRIFSGRLKRGMTVRLLNAGAEEKIQQVSVYMGARRDRVDEIPGGNIAAVTGLKAVKSGETVVGTDATSGAVPFEEVKYVSDPVMTLAIEPDKLRNLNRLREMLKEVLIQDPNLSLTVSEETGEVLLSGMGPLHLEVVAKEIKDRGLEIITSKPMAVYRESVAGTGCTASAGSANGKNQVKLKVSRLEKGIVDIIRSGKCETGQVTSDLVKEIVESNTIPVEEAKKLAFFDKNFNCLFFLPSFERPAEQGGGVPAHVLRRIFENVAAICLEGPLCKENLRELKITILELEVAPGEDDRTDGDLSPMLQKAIFDGIRSCEPVLLEPIYKMEVQLPPEFLGPVTSLAGQYHGRVTEIDQQTTGHNSIQMQLLVPVRVSIEFVEALRSATSGRAFWQYQFDSFREVPASLQGNLVKEINHRKGALVEENFEEVPLADLDWD